MGRYYFHLIGLRERLPDPEGRWVEDADQIALVALQEARWLISQDALRGEIDLGLRIEVEDDRGDVVHRLHFQDAVNIVGARG